MAVEPEIAIACDPTAIRPERRERWVRVVKDLYKSIDEIQELPDGYAFRLPTNSKILMLAAEDMDYERLCCPFLRFELVVEPNGGPFWLRMSGGEGAKQFLRLAFESGDLLNERVARAAGLNLAGAARLDSVDAVLETISSVNERFSGQP